MRPAGKELWTYDPHIDGQWARYACCDAVNRGLAAFDGRLYVAALDGWLHALDARTGELVWKVDTVIGRAEHKPVHADRRAAARRRSRRRRQRRRGFRRRARLCLRLRPQERRAALALLHRAAQPRGRPAGSAAPRGGDQDLGPEASAGRRAAAAPCGTAWPTIRRSSSCTSAPANAAPYNMHLGGRRGGDELYAASIIAIHADDGIDGLVLPDHARRPVGLRQHAETGPGRRRPRRASAAQ